MISNYNWCCRENIAICYLLQKKFMKIIVTGGAGFIGANIVHKLYQEGIDEIIVVDNLDNGDKYINIKGVPIYDYCDKQDFLEKFCNNYWGKIDGVYHQGACSSTVEADGQYMLESNYHFSKALHQICVEQKIPLIYASSAAVYGLAELCVEDDVNPTTQNVQNIKAGPLNVYGYSKWLFDMYLLKYLKNNSKKSPPVVGLRYFNVYGEREQHKGRMASVAYHLHKQIVAGEPMKLFGAFANYKAGEQKRDFIYIDDVVAINLFFMKKFNSDKSAKTANISGVYNCGTGIARPFNEIACALAKMEAKSESVPTPSKLLNAKKLKYVPFPDDLKGKYQSFTQADLSKLRAVGYTQSFTDLYSGVAKYWQWLEMVNRK